MPITLQHTSELAAARRRPRVTPRLVAALLAGKSVGAASRLLGHGGGTSLPGMVARRVDPNVLRKLAGATGLPVVAITGSNGKTTTARLCAALLRGEGVDVVHNPAGSNLVQGVTSLVVRAANLRGELADSVVVAEVDEGALGMVAPETLPRVLLVTGVFRDQLDRYGELYAVAAAIDSVASKLGPEAALVVNGDDPLVADMARGRDGRRIVFGMALPFSTDRITGAADSIRCPRCRSNLTYTQVYLSHLGDYRCRACGFQRPPLDVAVTAIEVRGLEESRFELRTPTGSMELAVPQPGLHIAYDAAAAVAISLALGVPTSHAATSLSAVGPAFGRLERIDADGRRVVLGFAKNPTSFNTTLRTLAAAGEPRHLLVAASNTLVDGEDFGWLWDVDFESVVPRIERVTVSGLRADELATRLKYAGARPEIMTVVEDRPAALASALATTPAGRTLTVLAGYTPTLELREEMRRRGWVNRFWEQ